jgi:septal ring-binding cell division protein DamX
MDCCSQLNLIIGDTMTGTLQLRKQANGITNPYPIQDGAIVEIHFPPFDSSAPVVLSTANEGELTIADATLSTISFVGSITKSLLLNPGQLQKLDLVITNTDGTQSTLTTAPVVNICPRTNP